MNEKQKVTLDTLSVKRVVIIKNYTKIGISHYSPTNHKIPMEFFSTEQKAPLSFRLKGQKTLFL
jgi:hypothetical protein